MMLGCRKLHGYVAVLSLLAPSFPAATTTTTSLLLAFRIASLKAWSMLGPPRLMLITFALLLTPKFRAETSLVVVHSPTVLQARSAMSFAFQQTPVVPRPLFPTAPIVPDTCVPCPLRSTGSLVL